MRAKLGVAIACMVLTVAMTAEARRGHEKAPREGSAERPTVDVSKYKHMAFVAAPGLNADAVYSKTILDEVSRVLADRGDFISSSKCFYDAKVDVKTNPPRVDLGPDTKNYDGIVCLTYTHGGRRADVDIYVIDVKSGDKVWHHELTGNDRNLDRAMKKHGADAVQRLKEYFYLVRR